MNQNSRIAISNDSVFYNILSSKYAKILANKLWLSRFLLIGWLGMPGASEFSANTTYNLLSKYENMLTRLPWDLEYLQKQKNK